ncbi:MAG: hypothetical protein K0B10_00395 [Vicingaceae bacterium]|nr:hypothetical protein [Vicingaceae bacterium]
MMGIAKNKVTETGFHFMLWGFLIVVASLTQYYLIGNGFGNDSNLVWLIMPVIGVPIAFIYEYKRGKKYQTTTKFDKVYGFLWSGFGITLVITIFISLAHHINPIAFILVLVGLTTFVSAAIYKFTPLLIGSIVFWITGILCVFVAVPEQLLIYAGAIFIGYVIPGLLLWKKSKTNADV